MRKHIFTISLLLVMLTANSNAQIANRDSILAAASKEREKILIEDSLRRAGVIEEYMLYRQKTIEEYKKYVASIDAVWGYDNFADDTKTDWVEYSDDFRSRSIVDFESGDITVEVVLDEKEKQDTAAVDQRLAQAIEKLLNSRGTTCPYESKVEVQEPLTQKPILEGLVDYTPYKGINQQTADNKKEPKQTEVKKENKKEQTKKPQKETKQKSLKEIKKENAKAAQVIAKQSKKSETTIKGDDGKSRKVVKVKMALVKDNLSKNAALYKDLVAEFSTRFNVEQPLIFAIIEQESAFNPEAKSWVPAFGLMQLVPTSGGLDAYRYVYKKNTPPTQSYLYNPRNNIELGTAYLHLLQKQFKSVSDDDCRRLCVIASYNTGAGNVSKAFIGSTNIKQAFSKINIHNYQSLYNFLTKNLKHEEARNYVSGVTKKREKYLKK